ncbi:hypothetical protein [Nocardia sp. NPDC051570]|uniref:hypothetical protein n=1 Tax=Nocardia sp. NPDC051570 TaxID=3364324 RepID=UPI0037AB8E85
MHTPTTRPAAAVAAVAAALALSVTGYTDATTAPVYAATPKTACEFIGVKPAAIPDTDKDDKAVIDQHRKRACSAAARARVAAAGSDAAANADIHANGAADAAARGARAAVHDDDADAAADAADAAAAHAAAATNATNAARAAADAAAASAVSAAENPTKVELADAAAQAENKAVDAMRKAYDGKPDIAPIELIGTASKK